MLLKQIDHIGICVNSLGKTLEKYQRLYQAKAVHIESMEMYSARIAFIPVGEVMVELIEPLVAGKGGIADFLDSHGEGIHHVCYRVNDIDTFVSSMKKADIKLMFSEPQPGGAGSRIIFLDPSETGNVLTEITERTKGFF